MPIHEDIERGDYDAVERALNADHSCKFELDVNRQTPLHIAARYGRESIIQLLLKDTKNLTEYIFTPDIGLLTALDYARINKHVNCIEIMMSSGVDLNATDQSGRTIIYGVLLDAARNPPPYNTFALLNFLLKLGMNVQHQDNGGDTYLEFINRHKLSKEYWILFLNYGAGIGFDFAWLNFNLREPAVIKFLEEITKGQLLALARLDDQYITQDTPGFKDAIFNASQLEYYFEQKDKAKLRQLLDIINNYIKQVKLDSPNRIISSELIKISDALLNHFVPKLREIVAQKIKFFQDNAKDPDQSLKKMSDQQFQSLLGLPQEVLAYLKAMGVKIPENTTPPGAQPKKPA